MFLQKNLILENEQAIFNYYKNIILAANLLKSINAKFLFFEVDKNNIPIPKNLENLVDKKWFVEETFIEYLTDKNCSRGEMGHFLKDGQFEWSNYLYLELKERNMI